MGKTEKKTIYIMDGYAFIYRSYYAFNNRALVNSSGFNVSAIFGFFKSLHSLLKKEEPKYFVVALDSTSKTFRHELYSEYKSNRNKTPEDLHEQIPFIQEALKTMNIPQLRIEGYEADDVIASIVKNAIDSNFEVRIISSDKDLMQLINDDVKMLKQDAKGKWQLYGEKEVVTDWEVSPSMMLPLLSLTGDTADNVPGVKGIGIKTAAKLLNEYGSLEGIYENIDKIKGAQKTKLMDGKESAFFSMKLIELDSSLNIGELEEYNIEDLNLKGARKIFLELELPSVAKLYADINFHKGNDLGVEADLADSLDQDKDNDLITAEQAKMKMTQESIKNTAELFTVDCKCVFYDAKKAYKEMFKTGTEASFPKDFFDLQIATYLIDSREKDYSINAIIERFMPSVFENEGYVDLERLITHSSNEPILLELCSILEKKLRSLNLLNLFYSIEMPLIPILAKMELRGVQLDETKLKKLAQDLDEKIEETEEKITEMAGYRLNISSYKQLQILLFEKRGLKGGKKGKNGFSTSSDELEKLKEQDAIIPLILEHRTYTKLRTTYTDSLIEMQNENGRLCTTFVQTGTATGRLSSQFPNLQNIPAHTEMGMRVREAFCAGKDNVLISSDYSQIELRVLAHFSQDEELIKSMKDGVDVHRRTASIVFGVNEELVTSEMRSFAKAVNFGVIYGMSPYGLSEELHITQKEAKQFISSYFATYKGVKDFIERSYAECEKQGYVCTIINRRRYVPEISSNKRQTVELGKRICVNTIIQGSAADIMKKAMIDVDRALKDEACEAQIILQVHDELILEVPKKEVEKVTTVLKEKMENAYNLSVPLTVSISKGTNWAELS